MADDDTTVESITAGVVADIPADDVFDLLSSGRRRNVLERLRVVGEPVTVTELAESVAAIENSVAPDELTDKQRKRVYVSLYQTHVPKLDDMGIVEYDRDEGTVTLTERGVALTDYFTGGDEGEDGYPWPVHYLSIGVVGAFSLVGVGVSVVPVDGVPVGIALSVLIVGSALVQWSASDE